MTVWEKDRGSGIAYPAKLLYLCSVTQKFVAMMKYPIGIQSFDQIIEGGFVYVDKTDMVYKLVKEGKIYSLCLTRRIGKSLLVTTLKHYFQGHK